MPGGMLACAATSFATSVASRVVSPLLCQLSFLATRPMRSGARFGKRGILPENAHCRAIALGSLTIGNEEARREPDSAAVRGWPSSRNLDLAIASRRRTIYGSDYCAEDALNPWPARCGEYNDGDSPRGEILLILEVCVGGDEDGKSLSLGGVEQFSVLELRPTALVSRHYLVVHQHLP